MFAVYGELSKRKLRVLSSNMNVTGLCGSFHPKKVRDGAALLRQARRLCSPVGSLSSGQGVGQRASKIGDRPKPNKGTAKHTAGRSSRLHQTSGRMEFC